MFRSSQKSHSSQARSATSSSSSSSSSSRVVFYNPEEEGLTMKELTEDDRQSSSLRHLPDLTKFGLKKNPVWRYSFLVGETAWIFIQTQKIDLDS